MSPFPKVTKGQLGYSIDEVDRLIARARDQYSNLSAHTLNWRELSSQGFTLTKGGYQPASVDAAIEKLQDTFAERELAALPLDLTASRVALQNRVSRAKRKRFAKVGVFALGYSRKQVDALVSIVGEYLDGGEKLGIDEIRNLKFKLQRGGYIESQVDSYIDRLVEHIQTERFSRPAVAHAASSNFGFTGFVDPADPGFQAY
jgi:DivIVA domain-containing protein